jgi:hypothetical protein
VIARRARQRVSEPLLLDPNTMDIDDAMNANFSAPRRKAFYLAFGQKGM